VDSFFSSLDMKSNKNRSKKSAMITIHRTKGLSSDHSRPSDIPDWALKPCKYELRTLGIGLITLLIGIMTYMHSLFSFTVARDLQYTSV